MNRILSKLFISLALIVLSVITGLGSWSVAAILLSFSFSMLLDYFDDKKARSLLCAGYALLCALFPTLLIGLPTIIYDIIINKNKIIYAVWTAAALFDISRLEPKMSALCGIMCFIALDIEYNAGRAERFSERLKRLQDDSAERIMRLNEKNHQLISSDNDIYTATLKERNRIAREIHDNVGHLLTRALLQTGALAVVTQDEEMKKNIISVRDTLNNAMTSVRKSVHDLHDDAIDMESAVREVMNSVPERFVRVVEYDCGTNVPRKIKLAFIAITKEAVNNAVKYSGGDRIHLSVQEYPAFYRLSVFDNGANEPSEDFESENGIGLSNMRERIKTLGGNIRIESSASGFRVFATVPKGTE